MKSIKINQIGTRFARAIFLRTALFVKRLGRIGGNCLSESSPLSRRVKGCRKFNLLKFRYDKIAAIGLLMVLVIGIGETTMPAWPLQNETEHEMVLADKAPKVGEVFEVVYRVRLKVNIPPEFGKRNFFVKFGTGTYGPAEVIGTDEICIPFLVSGEWQEVRGKYRIPKPYKMVFINTFLGTAKGHKYRMVGGCLRLFLIDSLTGQYGTKEQWLNRGIGVLGKYNNVEPQWFSEIDPAWAQSNRKIVQEMRRFEPSLSDSLALCLHQDNYLLIINAIGDSNATDSERIEHLLKEGWLDAQRLGVEAKEKWFNEFMEKNRGKWGGNPKLNFFRDNNSTGSIDYVAGNNSPKERITTTFIGTWRYQDHLYNKDNGLLWSYAVKPVKTAEVGVRAYWLGQGQIFVGWGSTDSSGNFTITTELIPYGATNVRAFPILYAWGPERYNEKIKISDPDTSISTWKNPRDRTIWWLPRPTGTPANYVTPGGTCNFSVCYPETATAAITQPRSGAANILETYLHARTFMSPPPGWQLRVMWEPGYDTTTKYKSTDTIFVCGNTTSNDDEWNDDILLHEFGHYLMHHYAQLRPTSTSPHAWWNSYPDDTCLAYQEGWAHFFSGRARTGTETDSLIVDTDQGIGSTRAGYLNLENPWDYSTGGWNPIDSFEGGPWCEGAVAGALWDIYDSHDEIPYPSYPDSLHGVWYPDTALADSLTMGPEEIWNVFDHYDPPGDTDTNCVTIFHFRSGWNSYNYGHQFALNQILLHHRIRDSIPDAPTGLSATLENYKVRLYWHKNSEPDLNGYRIYRRSKCLFVIPPQWSSWGIIVENSSPTDTTHLDTTVQRMYRYEYKLTAYDSLGNESEFSDSVCIDVLQKDMDENSPPFVRNSVIKDIRQLVLMVPEGSHVLIVKIYDCTGRVIDRQEVTFEKGFSGSVNICNRRGKNLPSGVYFVDIQNDNDLRVVEKIVIIK